MIKPEKDEKKRVTINSDGYYPQCPACGRYLNEKKEKERCTKCGQLLKWPD